MERLNLSAKKIAKAKQIVKQIAIFLINLIFPETSTINHELPLAEYGT